VEISGSVNAQIRTTKITRKIIMFCRIEKICFEPSISQIRTSLAKKLLSGMDGRNLARISNIEVLVKRTGVRMSYVDWCIQSLNIFNPFDLPFPSKPYIFHLDTQIGDKSKGNLKSNCKCHSDSNTHKCTHYWFFPIVT